ETFHSDRGWISHDAIIGQPEGSWVRSSMGLRYLAVRPTLAEFVLDMPRGAQVIYPKDLAMILFWADIYPGCRVLEAGTGSAALTLALLRAVGPEGRVTTFEQRDEFARRALANIHMRCGEVTNLTMRLGPVEDGVADEEPVDRVLLDLPEPWRLTQAVARVLRPGGIFLSYVPTIIQSHQIAEALNREREWALVETFETLYRPWNIEGTSVRPFHRMVAHTGFITVARRVMPEERDQTRSRAYLRAYSRVYRDRFSPTLAEQLGLPQQAVNDLVQEAVVVQRARAEGLEVGDEELNAQIQAVPAFAENGRFSLARYQDFLRRRGVSASAFENDVRRELTRMKVETT